MVNGEIHKEPNKASWDFFFKRLLSQETAATWYFLGFIGTPPWPLSVKPHTTGLNFSSILTKQCISFNPTHWYLNIPLDQTHPFLKGFYFWIVITSRICWYGFWQHWRNFWIWPLYKLSCDPQASRTGCDPAAIWHRDPWTYRHYKIIKPFVSFQLIKFC